jgi:hypothetical protein
MRQSEAVIVGECPASRSVHYRVYGSEVGVLLALFEQFVGECCTEIVGQ